VTCQLQKKKHLNAEDAEDRLRTQKEYWSRSDEESTA
jgi:hypothetical protein